MRIPCRNNGARCALPDASARFLLQIIIYTMNVNNGTGVMSVHKYPPWLPFLQPFIYWCRETHMRIHKVALPPTRRHHPERGNMEWNGSSGIPCGWIKLLYHCKYEYHSRSQSQHISTVKKKLILLSQMLSHSWVLRTLYTPLYMLLLCFVMLTERSTQVIYKNSRYTF